MRIAIIGSGISGLSAALVASAHANVTLFEKETRLGGHAHAIATPGAVVDTGFMVFNPPRYPEFCRMLSYLDIESVATTMSFSVSIPDAVEYASYGLRGLFADRSNIARPSYYAFLVEILRFCVVARRALHTPLSDEISLGDFQKQHGFSGPVIDLYLRPMLAAIWSCGTAHIDDFPALATFRFLENHQLLTPWTHASWRTIPGSSQSYLDALEKNLRRNSVDIRLGANIRAIRRSGDGARIDSDTSEPFDHVIIATHADTALELLAEPTDAEREILGSFTYSKNRAVLHSDASHMPTRKDAWASWNFIAENSNATQTLSVTYNMNYLQHIETTLPRFVTLNPSRTISSDKIFAEITYTHPRFNTSALRAQKRLSEIQGALRTSYAGAHWGYGFHEDGAASGISAAESLGFVPPWK